MYKELFQRAHALLMVDYYLSDEPERIVNPIIDEDKLSLYLDVIQRCAEYSEELGFEFSYDEPGFPKDIHMMSIKFPTKDDEIEIGRDNVGLFKVISMADTVNMDTDLAGNVRIYVFFTCIYTERG